MTAIPLPDEHDFLTMFLVMAILMLAILAVTELIEFDEQNGADDVPELVLPKPFFSPPQVEPIKIPSKSVIHNNSVLIVEVK